MVRSVVGVILGYILMSILQIIAFMSIYSMMGADWSFRPGTYEASTAWTAMQFTVVLVTAVIAGFVCAAVAKGGKAPLALAGLVLVLGFALGVATMTMRPDAHEARAGNVSNMDAANKARHPAWVILLGPIIGAAGVLIGGKLKRRG
jgi:fatty acid desaturase